MEEVARKGSKENPVRMNLDITQKEKEVLDIVMAQAAENKRNGMPLDFNIPRAQMELVSKFITPFQKMADIFLNVQKGRGNSEITIKHYEQSIRKLCKFFCWLNQEEDIYETLTDANRVAYGGAQPYAVFERDDFEAHFRDFLTEAEGVSEITVATTI